MSLTCTIGKLLRSNIRSILIEFNAHEIENVDPALLKSCVLNPVPEMEAWRIGV